MMFIDCTIKTLFCIVVAVLLSTCGFRTERPLHRDRMDVGRDSKGRIVYQKFDQLIDDHGERSLATITQHFDTAGRLLSEFGIDHPRLGKQYLYEVFYDSSFRVVNYFRWPKVDTAQLDIIPITAFVEQRIFFDSAASTKFVRITKLSINDKFFKGWYYESLLPTSKTPINKLQIKSYTFTMPARSFLFDDKGRLILNNLTITSN